MSVLKIDRLKFNNYLLFLTFFATLTVCFGLVVRNEYAFQKVNLNYQLDLTKLAVGTVCIGLHTFILTSLNLKDFHYSIASLILIFFVFPSAVIFTFVTPFDYRIFLSHNILFLAVLAIGKLKIKFKSSQISIKQSKRLLSLIVIIGMLPFVILYAPYINLKNLLLIDIYETRESLGQTVQNVYTDYSYSWFNKFIIPCLLVFAIYFKDRFILVIGSLSLVFLFLCGAHKTVFAGLFITFILYKYDYITKINYLLKILISVGLIALIVALVLKNDFLMTMTMRRALLLPAMVDVLYFDMFDKNPMLWSETFNGWWKIYPYKLEHSFVIGEKYFGFSIWGANNGIISDGFMNAGMIGVLINSILIAFYFSVLNQLNISPRFFGLFFLFVFAILSGALTTVLLSHGGIILILLAFFFMKNTNEQMVVVR